MFSLLFQLFPPTPTPLPPSAPAPVILPDNIGLWSSAPTIINLWNLFGNYAYAAQILVILAVVIAAGFVFLRVVRSLDNEDSVTKRVVVNVRQIFSPTYRRRRR